MSQESHPFPISIHCENCSVRNACPALRDDSCVFVHVGQLSVDTVDPKLEPKVGVLGFCNLTGYRVEAHQVLPPETAWGLLSLAVSSQIDVVLPSVFNEGVRWRRL